MRCHPQPGLSYARKRARLLASHSLPRRPVRLTTIQQAFELVGWWLAGTAPVGSCGGLPVAAGYVARVWAPIRCRLATSMFSVGGTLRREGLSAGANVTKACSGNVMTTACQLVAGLS